MRTDSPVTSRDQDFLGRYDFAEYLVKGMLNKFQNGQDSVVIGITGEWGSGKSSLLEFVNKEIQKQTESEPYRNYVYQFNPWRILNQDELQKEFLKELGIKLGNYSVSNEQLKSDYKKIGEIAGDINKANPEPKSKIAIGIIAKLIKKFSIESSLEKLKEEVDEHLADNNIKMFILIDDIDRLSPKEITEIFQLVKLNANFKNTYFVIAFDKKVVVEALSKQYHIEGQKYIEKIVQVDYAIPSIPSEKISEYFSQELRNILKEQQLKVDLNSVGNFWGLHLEHYFTTLRHIIRYFNAIDIRLPAISNDINFYDFLLIETIRLFDYDAYEWISKNYENLTLANISEMEFAFGNGSEIIEKRNNELDKLVKGSDDLKNVTPKTKDLIILMFSLKNAANYETLSNNLIKEKRISSPDYFEHYFSFKILSRNIPDFVISSFLHGDKQKRYELLEKYKTSSLIHKFLKGILFKIQVEKELDDFGTLCDELLEYSDYNLLNYQTEYFDQSGWFVVISFLFDVAHEYDKNNKGFTILIDKLLEEKVSFSRYLILDRVISEGNDSLVYSIPSEVMNDYRGKVINRHSAILYEYADSLLENKHNLQEHDIIEILRALYKVNEEKYDSTLEGFIKSNSNAILIFKYSLVYNIHLNSYDSAYSLAEGQNLLPKITIDTINERLSKIEPDKYNGDNKDYLLLFYNLKAKNFKANYFVTLDGVEFNVNQ